MACKRSLYKLGLVLLILAVITSFNPSLADAMTFQATDTTTVYINPSLTYGAAWRVSEQNNTLLANINGDDGNRNFDQWDMINNRFNLNVDIDINKGNYGIFIRPRAYYDFAYDGTTANDSPTTFNNGPLYGGPLRDHKHFDPKVEDLHRDKAEILDLFAYSQFYVGGHSVSFRVGRQVVNWGESVFIPGGVGSAMAPVDGTAANAPGTELKDIYLPVGQVYSLIDITDSISIAGYYQWEWEKTRLDEAGAYFNTSDLLDDAGRRILIPADIQNGLAATVDRARDDNPDDQGQYGFAIRYVAEKLNYSEFSFYYINYHDKAPQLVSQAGGGISSTDWGSDTLNFLDSASYFLRYAEDIKLYGFSLGTTVGERGDINIGCDITYREDFPLLVRAGSPLGTGYVRGNAFQAQVSAIYAGGPNPLGDKYSITTEFGYNKVSGYGNAVLVNDKTAWGGTVKLSEGYLQVLPSLDIDVAVTYKWNPDGKSSVGGTFTENADSVAFGVDLTYKVSNITKIGYTNFLGDSSDNSKTDRDYVSISLKRTF